MAQRDAMDAKATAIILVLCFLWGGNQVAIKLSNAGVAPIFGAAARSVMAGTLVALWALARGRSLVLRGEVHPAVVRRPGDAGGRPIQARRDLSGIATVGVHQVEPVRDVAGVGEIVSGVGDQPAAGGNDRVVVRAFARGELAYLTARHVDRIDLRLPPRILRVFRAES